MLRRLGALAAVAALGLLATGCVAGPGAAPESTGDPGPSGEPEPPAAQEYPLEAAWLDEGRLFALVTWGSSSCVPAVESVEADGQRVSVTFAAPEEDLVCTMDYAPRASLAALPEGVDPTEDVEVTLVDPVVPDAAPRVELDGDESLKGLPGEPTDHEPSAGWYDDEGLVLLTWGSSSCPPVVQSLDEGEDAATVVFATEDRVCTMDMAPRLTLLGLTGDHDEDDFVLTLSGDGFDGVTIRPLEN